MCARGTSAAAAAPARATAAAPGSSRQQREHRQSSAVRRPQRAVDPRGSVDLSSPMPARVRGRHAQRLRPAEVVTMRRPSSCMAVQEPRNRRNARPSALSHIRCPCPPPPSPPPPPHAPPPHARQLFRRHGPAAAAMLFLSSVGDRDRRRKACFSLLGRLCRQAGRQVKVLVGGSGCVCWVRSTLQRVKNTAQQHPPRR